MDLYSERVNDQFRLSGLTGVFEHILAGVLADQRWRLRWAGWNASCTQRTLDICYVDGGRMVGSIAITLEETFHDSAKG